MNDSDNASAYSVYESNVLVIHDGMTTLHIDRHTGVVISKQTISRQNAFKTHDTSNRRVGIDTKWLTECVTEDDVLKTLNVIDGRINHKVEIDHEYLNYLVVNKHITLQQMAVLHYIMLNICAWNFSAFKYKNLTHSLTMLPAAASRALKGLEDWIEIIHQNHPYKGDFLVKVHPSLAWKGSYMFRDTATKIWIEQRVKH